MSYVPGTSTWGGEIGSPSGVVTWSSNSDYLDNLTKVGTNAEFDDALVLAFDRWENVASIDFQRLSSGGQISVGSKDLEPGSSSGPSSVAGLAEITYSNASTIVGVDFFFATDLTWAPTGSGGTDFFAVALHEIGHAFGLEHVPDTSEIMNDVIFADDLGNGDIAAAQYLYGRDSGDAPLADAEQVAPPTGVSSDGGGGGGAIAAIIGLLALVFGFLPVGAVALAAGKVASDNDDADLVPDTDELGQAMDLANLLPMIEVTEEHILRVDATAENADDDMPFLM